MHGPRIFCYGVCFSAKEKKDFAVMFFHIIKYNNSLHWLRTGSRGWHTNISCTPIFVLVSGSQTLSPHGAYRLEIISAWSGAEEDGNDLNAIKMN